MRLITLLFVLLGAAPAAADDTISRLTQKLDRLYRADSSHAKLSMQVVTPDFERTLRVEAWSEGLDKMLVRILSPKKEEGTATLRRGNEMWNHLPRIRKTIRIPPSMMMGSWMGSDFTNDDLLRATSWEQDYTAQIAADPPAGQVCLDYSPKPDAAVTWSRVRVCFDAQRELPVTQAWFDEKGREARRMTLDEVKAIGGRELPTRMTLVPLLEKGRRTVVTYESLAFDVKHDSTLFSETRLRRGE